MATWFKGRRKDNAGGDAEPTQPEYTQQDYAQPEYAQQEYAQQEYTQPEYVHSEYAASEYPPPVYADPPQPGVAPIDPAEHEQLIADRKAMVSLCLYAHDRARSSGVAERLEEGLAAVGVRALRPDGERFDPVVHEAGGTADTADPALDGVVAETEVVGFSDRGVVLRPPIVTVYKAHGA
ncbi:nucleotide exchange factor GrpE [Actinokineospora guangxiensis]|uniref:Nucleotide exchange factor GrpE n=1 Tax=Actinokineospora guangxiensis TaxID=1490288 RepID=A0ABW0EDX0_9PSEU